MIFLLAFVALTLTSAIMVFGLRFWTQRRGILDIPNHRSSHSRPTPRGGGLAIVAVCMVGVLVSWAAYPDWHWKVILAYLLGGALIASAGWIDDVRSLSAIVRLVVQSAAALLLILTAGYWNHVDMPIVGEIHLGWAGAVITFLWIVGLTNAFNFMDGIDGIAGSQAFIAGLGWCILGTMAQYPAVVFLGLLLAASCLGFLFHNLPPARIFLGDVGSAFLGYTLAVAGVVAAGDNPRLAFAGVLLVWPFVFDAASTFSCRAWRGENVFAAHRSHFYQRLVISGWTHGGATALYAGLAVAGLTLAVVFVGQPRVGGPVAVITVFSMAVGLWAIVVRQETKRAATEAGVLNRRAGMAASLKDLDTVREGRHLTLVSTEAVMAVALASAAELARSGFQSRVLKVPAGSSLEEDSVLTAAHDTGLLVILEEDGTQGESYGAVTNMLREAGIPDVRCHQIRMPAVSEKPSAEAAPAGPDYRPKVGFVVDHLYRILKRDFHVEEKSQWDDSATRAQDSVDASITEGLSRYDE